jgi:crotonobetainyl-CoA:carnitine CoA-transferase CaiB-like acyl-CoA transferase
MTGVLEGVRVVDLSDGLAGGYCTKLLAGLGAEVLKIEAPGMGDPLRRAPPFKDDEPSSETSAVHLHINMGKKSLTLDTGSATGRMLLRRLIDDCDILVETGGPRAMQAAGLSYEELAESRPDLILTSVTHFGTDGPYADYKGGELVDYSVGGYTFVTGLPDREPLKAGGSQALYQGGLHAATATMAALLVRQATGEGDHLDVSITEAICYAHAGMSAYLNNGQVYRRVGARLLSDAPQAPYPSTILPARDGFVHAHWAPADPSLLGVLIGSPRLTEPEVWAEPRGHADEIDEALTAWLSQHTKAEAVRKAQELRHPFTEVLTPADLLKDPQLEARGFLVELEHPAAGTLKHIGAPFMMSGTPLTVQRAPTLGEHNREVLCGRLGLSAEELVALRDRGVI